MKGIRYDSDKPRFDLVPAYAQEQYVAVLTFGAKKYSDRNWEKGMKWSRVIASMMRHLEAIRGGEDCDPESGILHAAHVMTNAAFLTEYYKFYPQGDDRISKVSRYPALGINIDSVLASWELAYFKKFPDTPSSKIPVDNLSWCIDAEIDSNLDAIREGDAEYWKNVPKMCASSTLPFEPTCYTTRRFESEEVAKAWLMHMNFPVKKVYVLKKEETEAAIAKEANLEWFVDSSYKNFREFTGTGICCYLFHKSWNVKFDVGHKRILSLSSLAF